MSGEHEMRALLGILGVPQHPVNDFSTDLGAAFSYQGYPNLLRLTFLYGLPCMIFGLGSTACKDILPSNS